MTKLQKVIDGIHADMKKPGTTPLTSRQLKQQADRRRSLAVQIRIKGGQVKPGYEE